MPSTRRDGTALVFVVALIAALAVPVSAAGPQAAAGGDRLGTFDPATATWSLDGVTPFLYGNPGDQPFMGDWDCDGTDTPGLYRRVDRADGPAGRVYLRNSNTTGIADVAYYFGNPGDLAVAGDFDGDGCDTVSLLRPSTGEVFVSNRIGFGEAGIGAAEHSYLAQRGGLPLGSVGAVAGDLDGDGADSVLIYLRDLAIVLGMDGGPRMYGNPGDQLVVGAWNGGTDALGVYRATATEWHLDGAARRAAKGGGDEVAFAWSTGGAPGSETCNGLPADFVGTPGNDKMQGTGADEVFVGLGGDDNINGGGGDDVICGGDGDDRIQGAAGNDTIFGEAGNDDIKGSSGDDFLDGGEGIDDLEGNGGNDTLLGRGGGDVLDGGPQFDTCDVGPDGLVEVNCENHRPQAADQSATVDENGPAITAPYATTDPDGDPTTYAVETGPAKGVFTDNGDGTFSFDPNGEFESLDEDESEDVTVTYRATDSHGAVSDLATITVTVTGSSDLVIAIDDAVVVAEDVLLDIAAPGVLGNDVDPNGDAAVVPIVNGQTSQGGGLDLDADGAFRFDQDDLFNHLAVGETSDTSFSYTVFNSVSSDTGIVTITVEGVNDAPTANDGSAEGSGTFLVTVSGTDPDDSDDLEVTGATATLGTIGTISNVSIGPDKNTATIEYTAPSNEPEDSIQFTIDDGNGGTDSGTVLINVVEEPADPPGVAGVDAKELTVEGSVDEPLVVLLNAASDVAGDVVFSIEPGTLTGGSLSGITPIDPDGAGPLPVRSANVTFTPPAGTDGTFSFSYRAAEDGDPANFDTALATVIIEPDAPPIAPVPPQVSDIRLKFEETDTGFIDLAGAIGDPGTLGCQVPPCQRAAQTDLLDDITDPFGDATNSPSDDPANPDLVSAEVGVTATLDNVAFEVRYGANGFDATTTRTGIVIDIDENPNTGFPGVDAANSDSSLLGIEYLINIGANHGANAQIRKWVSGNTFVTVATVPATILADGHHVAVDLGLLGDDDGEFGYKVTTQSQISPTPGFTGILDYMPDLGQAAFVNEFDVTLPLRYTLLTLPSTGTLLNAEGDPINSVPTELFASQLTYQPSGVGTVQFDFSVKNTGLLSTVKTVFLEVVAVGTCETAEAFCDDGR